jgi:hypothetical protein
MVGHMETLIERYRRQLIGKSLSHYWRGYGSAIFLEFGELRERAPRSGSSKGLRGEFGVMIQWSWRVERDNSIMWGSWSDDAFWEPFFIDLKDATAIEFQLFGQIPEIMIALSSGHRIVSFMTADGDPQWTLFDRSSKPDRWLHVREGKIQEGAAARSAD